MEMKKFEKNKILKRIRNAQVSIEFMFCMIIVFLLIYGVLMIFRWTGLDLLERRRAHDSLLYKPIVQDWGTCLVCDVGNPPGCSCSCFFFLCIPCGCLQWSDVGDGPIKQIDPYFYKPIKMNAVFNGMGMLN